MKKVVAVVIGAMLLIGITVLTSRFLPAQETPNDFKTMLKNAVGKEAQVAMPDRASWELTLAEVASDYLVLKSHKAIYYVPISKVYEFSLIDGEYWIRYGW